MARSEPSVVSVEKIRRYVEHYWAKSGTAAHPDPAVTEAVVAGLAANLEEVGRPLCPPIVSKEPSPRYPLVGAEGEGNAGLAHGGTPPGRRIPSEK